MGGKRYTLNSASLHAWTIGDIYTLDELAETYENGIVELD